MKQYFIGLSTKNCEHKLELVQKLIIAVLLCALVSVFSFPKQVFSAELTLKNKREASLILSPQNNNYPNILDTDQTGLDITGDMTIALWIKPATLSDEKMLVSKWNHVSQTSYMLHLAATSLDMSLNSSSNGFGYRTFSVPYTKNINEWTHITMVYTAVSGKVEFFIDGVSVGKSADFLLPTSIADTAASFIVGSRDNGDARFEGNIDDVRIWSRSLSSTEVNSLYKYPKKFNNGLQLQGYWKFNGNLNDESGNSNNLGTTFSPDVPF